MSDAMTTDLYEVTMALLYLREGLTRPATFSLFVRDVPPDRGFLVAADLESVLGYLSGFRVDAGDVEVFASVLDRPPRTMWNRCSASRSPVTYGPCPKGASLWPVNLWWRSPHPCHRSVLLPAPFSPTIPTSCPAAKSRLTPHSTWRRP
ncbi:hypothetical protein GCM10020000_04810 [Streptomyces olivoverticillatus]